jgi:hypothetical protein
MIHHIDWQTVTDISKDFSAFSFRNKQSKKIVLEHEEAGITILD